MTPAALTDPVAIYDELQRRLESRPRRLLSDCSRSHLPRVFCADGFNVSVQANRYNYCAPRDDEGPWWAVELGFPSAPMPQLAEYCDSDETNAPTATETVWAYVPLSKVAEVLASHGGLMPETTP